MESLIIYHATGVSEIDIAALKEQIPEQFRSIPITVIENPKLQKGLILASRAPSLMRHRGIDLINKNIR
ncbi:hypothetical protein D3C85_1712440 [compost metagenome]